MTDKEYEATKARLEKYLTKWFHLLEMNYYKISYEYFRNAHEEDEDILGVTNSSWEYRHGHIRWYMPALATRNDEELQTTIIHEFLHILTAPIAPKYPNQNQREKIEFTVTTLARLYMNVDNDGEGLTNERREESDAAPEPTKPKS